MEMLIKKKSVILLHGVFAPNAFEKFSDKDTGDIFLMEGRPSLEAVASNAKALKKLKIKSTVISDNMAGFLFFKDLVKEVRLASQYTDRDGALCDTGALILGVLARRHKVPVKVFPGARKARFLGNPKDILKFKGKVVTPKGTRGYVPLVEWLPGKYLWTKNS